MYEQPTFVEERPEVLEQLIREQPLGLLVVQAEGELVANQIPFVLVNDAEGERVLEAHVARANPVWRSLPLEALVVFQGPQAYVTPSWYPSKQEHGRVVPTWNYVMVQARGRAEAIEDAGWLRGQLERFTEQQEQVRTEPWAVDDAPAEFTGKLMDAIVGIRIPLRELRGKWKVSQNRPAADRVGVHDGLLAEGNFAMASQVKRSAKRSG